MDNKRRKRTREEGSRGGGFQAADAWYDCRLSICLWMASHAVTALSVSVHSRHPIWRARQIKSAERSESVIQISRNRETRTDRVSTPAPSFVITTSCLLGLMSLQRHTDHITTHLPVLVVGAGFSERRWMSLTQAEKRLSTLTLVAVLLSAMQEFYTHSGS